MLQILVELIWARSECSGAAVGSATRSAAAPRTALTSPRPTHTMALASVWPAVQSPNQHGGASGTWSAKYDAIGTTAVRSGSGVFDLTPSVKRAAIATTFRFHTGAFLMDR